MARIIAYYTGTDNTGPGNKNLKIASEMILESRTIGPQPWEITLNIRRHRTGKTEKGQAKLCKGAGENII